MLGRHYERRNHACSTTGANVMEPVAEKCENRGAAPTIEAFPHHHGMLALQDLGHWPTHADYQTGCTGQLWRYPVELEFAELPPDQCSQVYLLRWSAGC